MHTVNPSADDNIFLAYFLTLPPAIVGQNIVLAPDSATNPVGTQHTVVATVLDDQGLPVSSRTVTFAILSGPNQGFIRFVVTDASGQARLQFTSDISGTDTIQASFTDNSGVIRKSNLATKTWLVPQFRLAAGLGADPSSPGTETRDITATIPQIRIPLGATFFLELTSATNVPLKTTASLTDQHITPSVSGATLFPNNVLVAFDPSTPTAVRYFQPVHFGTARAHLTAPDGTPTEVNVTVVRPDSLGTTHSNVDGLLMDVGHSLGIPPQAIKGQIDHESGFNPESYRYEPLTVDFGVISTGRNLRDKPSDPDYGDLRLYRLATSDGLPQGTGIASDDISPRDIFCIKRTGVIRSLTDTDSLVSAKEIFALNDHNTLPHNPACYRANWSDCSGCDPATARRFQMMPSLLDFTAQTPLAASYGYLQILLTTAYKPMKWNVTAGVVTSPRHPHLLFDTAVNQAAGNGSVHLGAGYLRRVFADANTSVDTSSPTFCGRTYCGRVAGIAAHINPSCDFDEVYRRAMNWYNHNSDAGVYGTDVLKRACTYLPQRAGSLFE